MGVIENVNSAVSDVSEHFLNELPGTVAVITSDGRMIVVRFLFVFFFTSYFTPTEACLSALSVTKLVRANTLTFCQVAVSAPESALLFLFSCSVPL